MYILCLQSKIHHESFLLVDIGAIHAVRKHFMLLILDIIRQYYGQCDDSGIHYRNPNKTGSGINVQAFEFYKITTYLI